MQGKERYGKQKVKATSNIISYVFIKKTSFEFTFKAPKLRVDNVNCNIIFTLHKNE